MRHAASLLAAMEGISRAAFRIAQELANNSRSGLTVRFLSKKLEIPEEEIEYLVDVNHRFLFVDLTKIKIAAEGINAVRRILRGLENRGDIPSLFRYIKSLTPQEYRVFEDILALEGPCPKKTATEQFIERYYHHPDSVVTYVATHSFSPTAREVFDIIWHSKEGVMPVSKIRALHGDQEYEVEQALSELFEGLALFEMFRFDTEDRLVRVAGLLSEVRQFREETAGRSAQKTHMKPVKAAPTAISAHDLEFSDKICHLIASIAARPVRLRGDGELFREDRRRLNEICPEEDEPSLSTSLWVAEGVGWLTRIDNELRVGELDALLKLDRVSRHQILCDWLLSANRENLSRRQLTYVLEDLKPGAWHKMGEIIENALTTLANGDPPILRPVGGDWRYSGSAASGHSEQLLVHALEGTLLWLGLVDCAEGGGDALVRLTPLGEHLLLGRPVEVLMETISDHKAEIIVQPNFDIVVPMQDMDPLLTVPLDQFAQRTSTGKATVYHLSKESFTTGIQEGHDGDTFIQFLLAHNRSERFPSNVMTTLEDWRGGMKRVRIRTIQIIESDDALVMVDLLHRRKFQKLLSPIDPQKVATYSDITEAELAKQLEKEGFIVE